ncbi:rhamnan synthesis F family protein [Brucella pituitosa]|uniref:Rhamnan synthesis protein F n=1 Tax=Brucella pituitosa TaxID=571256 RepID=A0ABS3K6M0_9HYPH|nr:rhamnan synthesis F family protein [Brucella pituitosa]MBO1041466.1 hypothetical protein [Brucella pituitosa]
MYYLRRAYQILQARGAKTLILYGLGFTAARLGLSGLFSGINGRSGQGGTVNPFGVVLARNLPDTVNPPIHIPFEQSRREICFDKAAVIAHIFYPELTEEIVEYLENMPVPFGLFITTDTEEKKQQINQSVAKSGLHIREFEVRVTPNRGRDIAPKYIGFRDVYQRYEAFLHLHTKKSDHTNGLGNVWRHYLLEHLIGSREIAEANLEILSLDNVGIVYPEHLKQIKKHINWGYDFPIAQELLAKAGVTLDLNTVLEFSSGSMFWGRSQAIASILDLKLDFTDFPEEKAQIDGTLAHAVERSLLYFVEKSGHRWARTTMRPQDRNHMADEREFMPLLGSEDDIT